MWSGEGSLKFAEKGVKVVDRSDVLDMLGYGNQPVYLQESKVVKGKREHHLTTNHWKKIPEWLDDPALVFDSDTVDGRLVFFAPELLNGDPILVVLDPDATAHGLQVNLLVNAYDKDSGKIPMRRWVNEGLLRYYNTKKSPAILARSGLQLSSMAQARGRSGKILREADLRKYQSENPPKMSRGSGTEAGHTVQSLKAAYDLRRLAAHVVGWQNPVYAASFSCKGSSPIALASKMTISTILPWAS